MGGFPPGRLREPLVALVAPAHEGLALQEAPVQRIHEVPDDTVHSGLARGLHECFLEIGFPVAAVEQAEKGDEGRRDDEHVLGVAEGVAHQEPGTVAHR